MDTTKVIVGVGHNLNDEPRFALAPYKQNSNLVFQFSHHAQRCSREFGSVSSLYNRVPEMPIARATETLRDFVRAHAEHILD